MKTKKTNFTLIELLVVVAIIAILAALLLPALKSARAKGMSAVCIGNMKQIGLAAISYAGDFKNYFPVSSYAPGSEIDSTAAHWAGLLAGVTANNSKKVGPYGLNWNLGTNYGTVPYKGVFSCPIEPVPMKWAGYRFSHFVPNGYMIGNMSTNESSKRSAHPLQTFTTPSQVFFAADNQSWGSVSSMWGGEDISFRHGSGDGRGDTVTHDAAGDIITHNSSGVVSPGGISNTLYADGHTEQMSYAKFATIKAGSRTGGSAILVRGYKNTY